MAKKFDKQALAPNLFLLAVALIPFYFVRFNIFSIPTTLYEIFLYLSFLVALITCFDFKMFKNPVAIYGLIFCLIALISALYPDGSARSLGIWRAYFFDGVLLSANYLLLRDSLDNQKIVRNLIASSSLVALAALVMFGVGIKTPDGRLLDPDMISPNYFSLYLAPIIVLGTIYALQNVKKNKFLILEVLIMLAALVLTYSRGGLVAIVVALAFYFVFIVFGRHKARSYIFTLLAIVFLVGGYLLFKPDFGSYGRVGNSSNIRFYIWQTSLEIIGKNPLTGVGLNNYQTYFTELTSDRINYPEYISPQALTAHNLYLHLLAAGGPLLLAVFIVLLFKSGFYKSTNGFRFALLAILVYGLIDTPFFRNDLAAVFWLLLIISSKEVRSENSY